VLAYSTISHLGLITLLLGLDSPLAAVAAVFHIMNHATFKASLFMAVGIIDHETGTRDMRGCTALSAHAAHGDAGHHRLRAMAGVPLLNGFLSKEMFFAENGACSSAPAVESRPAAGGHAGRRVRRWSIRCASATTCSSARRRDTPRTPHEPVRWMRAAHELLVLACLSWASCPTCSIGGILQVAGPAGTGGNPAGVTALASGTGSPLRSP
jgi:multicomponent K+:H+ antiporter subunit A